MRQITIKFLVSTTHHDPTHGRMRLDLLRVILWALVFCLLVGNVSVANDSAASIAAGGIQLTREARISMEKERLVIRHDKIIVEYEFLNGTDQDITTEVAFPVPPYFFNWDNSGGPRDFDDFRVTVENKPIKYSTQAKAELSGHDYTELLQHLGVDISSFGHFDYDFDKTPVYEITKLPKQDQQKLTEAGLLDGETLFPSWTVNKIYHWAQTFHAHQILHVRHEYTPAWGWMDVMPQQLDPVRRKQMTHKLDEQPRNNPADNIATSSLWSAKEIEESCIDPSLLRKADHDLLAGADPIKKDSLRSDYVLFWVDYILTTANNWKRPIKDFELAVERPQSFLSKNWYVSFCWDGPLDHVGADRFVVRAKNFVPEKDLHIAFLGVELQPIVITRPH